MKLRVFCALLRYAPLLLIVAIGACGDAPRGNDAIGATGGIGEPVCADADNDGVCAPDDCDDTNATVFPGARELACDGIDQDCDGSDETTDDDGDDVCDGIDNCPGLSNPDQLDSDEDGAGDACDVCPSSPTGDSDSTRPRGRT